MLWYFREIYPKFLLLTHVGNAVKCCRGKTKKFNIHTSMLLWSRCSSWCFHWRKSCTPFWLFCTIRVSVYFSRIETIVIQSWHINISSTLMWVKEVIVLKPIATEVSRPYHLRLFQAVILKFQHHGSGDTILNCFKSYRTDRNQCVDYDEFASAKNLILI